MEELVSLRAQLNDAQRQLADYRAIEENSQLPINQLVVGEAEVLQRSDRSGMSIPLTIDLGRH